MIQFADSLKDKLGDIPAGFWMIGVSGGADSVFLLHLMTARREAGYRFEAIHVNHGLRGAESDEDETFVRALCEKTGIPLYVRRPDLHGKADENSAREARYSCFHQCVAEHGADGIILAHHEDDLAETFLMRLMRGAGTEGLGCMREADVRNGVRILRPMLRLRRDEIRKTLREAGIEWREDSSNANEQYFRNAVRQKLIPQMEEMIPGVTGRLAATARVIAEDNCVLDAEADSFLKEFAYGKHLDAKALERRPEGLQARILRHWWAANAPITEEHTLNYRQTEDLKSLIRNSTGTVNLPGGLTAIRGKRWIHLTGFPRNEENPRVFDGKPVSFGGLTLEANPGEGNPGNGKNTQEMPECFADGCIVRFRRPGDRIRPFGMAGSRKLQDYLTDRGVEAPWRDEIPLLCKGNEVIWVAGVGTGAVPRQTGEDSHQIRLRWMGQMPWMNEN